MFAEAGDYNVEFKPVKPPAPSYYLDPHEQHFESLKQVKFPSKREIDFTHPLKEVMGPKECP
jgi:hypothetical protein